MTSKPEALLTICTVSFGHKELILKNIKFVEEMNTGDILKWIIVENMPPTGKDRFESREESSNLKIIEGVPNNFTGLGRASQHHASGLNLALKEVDTRFVLILDPDFYIVRKNWAREVMDHMKDKGLVFFGAPYNPKRYLKYRYFPCIHCMFIDLEKISKDKIDFAPQYKK